MIKFNVVGNSSYSYVPFYKGIRFIVLYPPKCSHDLPPLAGTVHTETIFNPPGDIPEQLAAYSAHTLSTALFMLGTHFAAG